MFLKPCLDALLRKLSKRIICKPTNSPEVGRDRVDLKFIKVLSRRKFLPFGREGIVRLEPRFLHGIQLS